MSCPKCRGMMVPEDFYVANNTIIRDIRAWRCVCCGEIVDPVIIANRKNNRVPVAG